LSWNPVDRGHYTVYLGPAGSGCTTVFAETDASLTQYLLDARTTYEWRVEASTVPGCPLTTTACQTFTTGNDCSIVPALLEPIGGTRAGPPVRFRWSEVPEATSYSLFLSTGDAPFVPLTTTTATSFTAPLLPLGKTRWYVTAAVDGCSAVRSDIASFEVLQGRKRRSASETRFPRHQKTDVHSVTIGIADSADPVHRGDEVTYDVDLWAFTTHVDELFHFAVRVELTNGILTHISNACHAVGKYWLCDFEVLEEGTEYFSVIATATAESPMALTVTNVDTYVPVTETTTVLPCSDAIPLPIVPANGAARVATRGELSWNPIDRGGYTVYLGPAGTGCTTVFGTTTASSFQYLLDASTAYEWRIEASTVAGCPLTGSACQSFTTGNDCAVIPALLEPIGGAKVSAPLTFRWSAVPEATSYSIFLSTGEAPFVPLGSTSGTSFSITLPANGKSRWYVTADVDGCTGVRSDIATFDILPARKRRSAR
jgi:uncharacterized protein YceK